MSDASPPEPKTKKSRLPMIIGAVVAVALLAGGGAYWYLHRAAPETAEAAHSPEEPRGIVTFEPFVVNLADSGSSRFLRVTLQIIVGDEKAAEEITTAPVALARARSAILELLTLQTSDQLVTIEGKKALKKAIAERVSAAIDEVKVLDVLFSDFVVQL